MENDDEAQLMSDIETVIISLTVYGAGTVEKKIYTDLIEYFNNILVTLRNGGPAKRAKIASWTILGGWNQKMNMSKSTLFNNDTRAIAVFTKLNPAVESAPEGETKEEREEREEYLYNYNAAMEMARVPILLDHSSTSGEYCQHLVNEAMKLASETETRLVEDFNQLLASWLFLQLIVGTDPCPQMTDALREYRENKYYNV